MVSALQFVANLSTKDQPDIDRLINKLVQNQKEVWMMRHVGELLMSMLRVRPVWVHLLSRPHT